MYGFNLLGVNSHDSNIHRTSKSLDSILEGASENFNSFKEVEEAIKELQAQGDPSTALKEYLNSDAAAQQISSAVESAVSGKNYVTEDSLEDFVKNLDIPEAYNDSEIREIIKGKADSEHSHTISQITDFPSSLPASDVPDWAKAKNKPVYTAEEVGALSSDTVIPEAQVQSDWNAEEGMGMILNKPEVFTKEEVSNLYSLLNARIAALEAAPSIPSQTSSIGYFAIIPGETTKEWKANLASETLEFQQINPGVTEINSGEDSGMIAVLYNRWIPKFNAFEPSTQKWQDADTFLNSAYTGGKNIDGEDYILWYNTGASVEAGTLFKVILP